MKLNNEEQKILNEYVEELNSRKKVTKEEVEELLSDLENNAYDVYRSLIQNYLFYAYNIAKTYSAEELTILDFIHAANEGLEIGVTSNEYEDYDSFIKCIDSAIKSSIELMLSYLD